MQSNREVVLERLEALVRAESPTGDVQRIGEVVDLLAQSWSRLGMTVEIIQTPAGPTIVADLPATAGRPQPPVLFIAHSDTVWPAGTIEQDLPWRRADGVITGPGVFDMKSGIVALEAALGRLVQEGSHPAVRIFAAADEETGSVHSRPILSKAWQGCSAAVGLESPHSDGGLKVGRFGSVRAKLSVTGVSAHAALDPESGVSATEELVDQLVRVRELVAAEPPVNGRRVLYNLGSISADGRANVVNDAAGAVLGFRFPAQAQEASVMGALRALQPIRSGAAVSLEILSHRPTWDPRPEDRALARLINAGGEPRVAAGAGDTNDLSSAPIPLVDGMGPRGGGAHALSEHIVELSLFERIDVIAGFLREWDGAERLAR